MPTGFSNKSGIGGLILQGQGYDHGRRHATPDLVFSKVQSLWNRLKYQVTQIKLHFLFKMRALTTRYRGPPQ